MMGEKLVTLKGAATQGDIQVLKGMPADTYRLIGSRVECRSAGVVVVYRAVFHEAQRALDTQRRFFELPFAQR